MKNLSLKFVIAFWLALSVAVSYAMTWYSVQPGTDGTINDLPSKSAQDQWHLDVFIHPKCACSHATISELERLLADLGQSISCTVHVYTPSSESTFSETLLLRRARNLPRVEVVLDKDGETAKSINANTSGACVLYDPKGKPRFFGGLTPSRAHEGDSVGKLAIYKLINGFPEEVNQSPIYGCKILKVGLDEH